MERWLISAAGKTSSQVHALVHAGALMMAVPTADAVGAETNGSNGPDKSKYNLFNPTPRELVREMATDRPDKTEAPFTVDAGHFQIEADVLNYTYDRYNSDQTATRVETARIAPVNLKAGICKS